MLQPKRSLIPPVARYALASIGFLIPAVWLAMLLACTRWGATWPAACEPINYPAAALATAVLVLAPIGAVYLERARRRAAKGMWQKVGAGGRGPGSGWLATFERSVRVMWGSEAEAPDSLITGEMRYERRGWWLSVKSGRRVWVDRWCFWQWLWEVEALAQSLPAGESPIGERRWQPVIGRDLWLAYCDILEAVGAIEYATDDLRSRRYVRGQAWGRVEEFEKVRGSEVR